MLYDCRISKWHGASLDMRQTIFKSLNMLLLIVTLAASPSLYAGLFGFGGTEWKEEVLLHDGQRIIVKRSQSYGGRHEIGQSSAVKEHTITFSLPNTGKPLSWTSEYDKTLGRANFNLLALHILNGTPYLVVEPDLCPSYNKWGRPNPPYLIFKHNGKGWYRIPLPELPAEFKTTNLIVDNKRKKEIESLASKLGYVSAEDVQKINSSLTQPEYRAILREPLPSSQLCPPEQTSFKAPYLIPPKSGETEGK